MAKRVAVLNLDRAASHLQGHGVIAFTMLVVLGKLFESGRSEWIPRDGNLGKCLEGCVRSPALLFERRDVPQGAKQQVVLESAVDRATEQVERRVVLQLRHG